jgi:uncharacterized membrane protein
MVVLNVLRVFFGVVFILFLPGYAWSFVFFMRREIEWVERIAISFGLSIVLVPLTVFLLFWLFHLHITLVNTAVATSALIVTPLCYLVIRKRSLGRDIASKLKGMLARKAKK